jgi:hypothetical protein
MPDLDLAAIRARHAELRALLHEMADELANANWGIVANAARWADSLVEHAAADDVPALLAEVDRLTTERDRACSELRQLADRLRGVRDQRDRHLAGRDVLGAIAEEARDALAEAGINSAHGGDDWPNIAPSIRELAADRDRWRMVAQGQTAIVTAGGGIVRTVPPPKSCGVDGCDGSPIQIFAAERAEPIVRFDCGHDLTPGEKPPTPLSGGTPSTKHASPSD